MPRPTVEIEAKVVRDDPDKKGVAIVDGTTEKHEGRERLKWFWVPRSLITVNKEDGTITMPEWLAQEKGLI